MITRLVKLRDLATTLLKKHQTPEAAAPSFAKALAADAELQRELELQFLRSLAPKPAPSRRRSGKHRRPSLAAKLPSAGQKAAAITASKRYAHEIFSRKLRGGKMLAQTHVGELRAFVQASASVTIDFLKRSYEDAVDLFACQRMADYCQVSDPDILLPEAIKGSVVAAIYDQARIDAADALVRVGELAREHLLSAAATRGQEQIGSHPA